MSEVISCASCYYKIFYPVQPDPVALPSILVLWVRTFRPRISSPGSWVNAVVNVAVNIEIMTMPTMIQTNPKRRPATDLGVLSPYLRIMVIKGIYLEKIYHQTRYQVYGLSEACVISGVSFSINPPTHPCLVMVGHLVTTCHSRLRNMNVSVCYIITSNFL